MFAANLRALLASRRCRADRPGHRPRLPHRLQDGRRGPDRQGAGHRPPSTRTSRRSSWEEALETLTALIKKHNVTLIAIGNGTASRETEQLAAEMIPAELPSRCTI